MPFGRRASPRDGSNPLAHGIRIRNTEAWGSWRATTRSLPPIAREGVGMTKFMVLYRSFASARDQMENATPEQRKAGMDAWMAWAARAGDAIVDLGSPLDSVTRVGAA